MLPIYKRELASCYKGFTGYLIALPLLVMGGLYTWVYCYLQGTTAFFAALSSLRIVLVLVIPVLTMRVMSGEKRRHTDQLLYSLPVSMADVVLGKYLAMVTVLALPLAVLGLYPLPILRYAALPIGLTYANLLAFWLLGCALIAMGQFISSCTENQTAALLLSLLFILLNFFLTALATLVSSDANSSFFALVAAALAAGALLWTLTKNFVASGTFSMLVVAALSLLRIFRAELFSGLFARVMNALCLFSRTESFQNGIFDLSALIYYLAVSAVFLFLSVQSMEKRRWHG